MGQGLSARSETDALGPESKKTRLVTVQHNHDNMMPSEVVVRADMLDGVTLELVFAVKHRDEIIEWLASNQLFAVDLTDKHHSAVIYDGAAQADGGGTGTRIASAAPMGGDSASVIPEACRRKDEPLGLEEQPANNPLFEGGAFATLYSLKPVSTPEVRITEELNPSDDRLYYRHDFPDDFDE